ncbi:hypothetical protein, partial [Streptomyces sp. NPDC006459]|uniref:hypothetical protein n=1 Tax=Streptomyces sp. NPDC006459 TaxID=3154303 RepID=UPI0033AC2753
MRDEFGEAFSGAGLAELFPQRGRPAVPPVTRGDLAEMEARIMNSIPAQGIAIATTMGERF